jgi:16S rRNA (adenine1518-N6/adenine1519-N6)-dimethyltransferase
MPQLDQHFLNDPAAADRIVEAAGVGGDDLVVEIGPGRGALTGSLVERACQVIGIEIDRVLCGRLEARYGQALRVVNADVLKVDLPSLVLEAGYGQAVLVGNLPYSITGSIVERVVHARQVFARAVLMVQREVARRIAARPGGKEYGILSIAVQLRARPECLFDIPPEAFSPSPKVHSSVVRLTFSPDPPDDVPDEDFFFRVVRRAFQQRRKMLKNTLLDFVCGREDLLAGVLRTSGVEPRLRPEAVSIPQFASICRGLASLGPLGKPESNTKGKTVGEE